MKCFDGCYHYSYIWRAKESPLSETWLVFEEDRFRLLESLDL